MADCLLEIKQYLQHYLFNVNVYTRLQGSHRLNQPVVKETCKHNAANESTTM